MSDEKKLDAHLFICTNVKERGESCGPKGGAELRNQVKALCQAPERGWGKRVRVNNAGCLGRCEEGIAAVLYPEGRWFTGLTKDSAPDLVAAVAETMERKDKK